MNTAYRRLRDPKSGDCPCEQFCCLRTMCCAPETANEVLPEMFACNYAEILQMAYIQHCVMCAKDGKSLLRRQRDKLLYYEHRWRGLWTLSPQVLKRECVSDAINVLKNNIMADLEMM